MTPDTDHSVTIGSRRATAIALCAILLPIVVFYGTLARYIVNLPYADDYNGVLEFLEHYDQLPSKIAKAGYILSAQHNEYKPMFANFVIAVQYAFSGHPSFILLSWIGNIFVLALLYMFWRHFLQGERDTARRLVLFVPVSFLLFQLQYAETLNWSMPGLQNIPILVFALACISSLTSQERISAIGAYIFLALTVAASGNGFLLVPIGGYILFTRKRWASLAAWAAVTAACAAIYFHHYNFHSSQQEKNGSVLHSVMHVNPIYALSFMGSAIGSLRNIIHYFSILLGLAIAAVILTMVRRRYDRINPTVFYYVVFLLLTSIAVSGIRSKLGLALSNSGRYKIYSDLLIICCYIFWAESSTRAVAQLRHRSYQMALAASLLFCVACDWAGVVYLAGRDADLVQGVRLYRQTEAQQGPFYDSVQTGLAVSLNEMFQPIMRKSEETGLYRFP